MKRFQNFGIKTKNEFLFNREQLEKFAMNDVGFFQLDLIKFSTLFLFQMFYHNFTSRYDIYNILNEVKYLEKIKNTTNTKKESQFKHNPLKGYWKKHFFTARDMAKNIAIYWEMDKSYNYNKTKKLDRELQLFFNKNEGKYVSDIMPALINLLIDKPLNKRKFTGNWIVYEKKNNNNFYITIAHHDESDENIFNKIQIANQLKEITIKIKNENSETI